MKGVIIFKGMNAFVKYGDETLPLHPNSWQLRLSHGDEVYFKYITVKNIKYAEIE